MAENEKGDSDFSNSGQGAMIYILPDSPINLVNIPAMTNAHSIALQWEDGESNGGSPIIDYRVEYK